jgi:hypothetical protein
MGVRKRLLAAVLGVGMMGVIGLSARASSVVSIDTGTAIGNSGVKWQYVGTTPLSLGDPTSPAPSGNATVISSPPLAWVSASTVNSYGPAGSNASWIGTANDNGGAGFSGDFTFSLTLHYADFITPVLGSPPQSFEISGAVSADNSIVQLYLVDSSNVPLPLSLTKIYGSGPDDQHDAYTYSRVFTTTEGDSLNNPFTLVAVVDNAYNSNIGNNPMGFIMAGTITEVSAFGAVPLPASVYSGLSVLGLMAAYKLRRKLA